jgi:hypothetical protein
MQRTLKNIMKKISLKLSAFALGAAVLSANAAATGNVASHVSATVRATSSFTTGTSMSLQTWDVTDANGSVYLALCVEPGVALNVNNAAYSNGGAYNFGTTAANNVARLYSEYYADITGTSAASKTKSLSFQLALWELNNDNANLKDGTLAFKWSNNSWSQNNTTNQVIFNDAAAMIAYATDASHEIEQQYTFTQFTMKDSQTIVYAAPLAAVPEPSTYAMLGLGLALVGFTARRRKQG